MTDFPILTCCPLGENGKITYSITSGDPNGDFRISPNGTITTLRTLDRETVNLYNLVVTATDRAIFPEKQLSSTVQVREKKETGSSNALNQCLLSKHSTISHLRFLVLIQSRMVCQRDDPLSVFFLLYSPVFYMTVNLKKLVFSLLVC